MEIKHKAQIIEAFNAIRVNIGFLGIENELKVILVTSAIKREGKSTIACNLANSYASVNKKTLLIDCDLRNSSVHRMLGISNHSGISDMILSGMDAADPSQFIQHFQEHLDVLTAGRRPPNPAELLSSQKMKQILGKLRPMYDFVIIDSPPILAVSDAVALQGIVDGTIMVIRHGFTTKEALLNVKKTFDLAGHRPLACIFNGIPNMQKKYSYYGAYEYSPGVRSHKRHSLRKKSKDSEVIQAET